MAAVIETDKLTKTYGINQDISDFYLQVNSGKIFGFLGQTGQVQRRSAPCWDSSGLPRGGPASSGGRAAGTACGSAPGGNMPGEFTSEDGMTGEQILHYFVRLRGVESLDYAHQLAVRFGADLKRPMRRLSCGKKQKSGLVHAKFHRPELLILDEPTGGLDCCPAGPRRAAGDRVNDVEDHQ